MFASMLRAAALVVCVAGPLAAQNPSALQVTAAGGETHSFSMADLDAMEQVTITTTTIWTEGEVTFSGPSLTQVLELAGIENGSLSLTALNDYAIEMPAPEADANYPIVATRLDGEFMSVRDKGPIWIVYPYDSDAAYQTETVYAQSIWQLDRIEVLE